MVQMLQATPKYAPLSLLLHLTIPLISQLITGYVPKNLLFSKKITQKRNFYYFKGKIICPFEFNMSSQFLKMFPSQFDQWKHYTLEYMHNKSCILDGY